MDRQHAQSAAGCLFHLHRGFWIGPSSSIACRSWARAYYNQQHKGSGRTKHGESEMVELAHVGLIQRGHSVLESMGRGLRRIPGSLAHER